MTGKINRYIFKICRSFARVVTPNYKIVRIEKPVTPSVYVVRHQNLLGPIISMIWFDLPVRLWVLSVFFKFKSCFRQYYDYTFTKRFGIPKLVAAVIAAPVSFFVVGLIRLIKAIPVYRNSRDIVKTFQLSTSALEQGQNILVCPDIDYSSSSSDMGEMYQGFLSLEKKYRKMTGKSLAFIPLNINKEERTISVGKAVYFDKDDNFRNGKAKVYKQLKQHMARGLL